MRASTARNFNLAAFAHVFDPAAYAGGKAMACG